MKILKISFVLIFALAFMLATTGLAVDQEKACPMKDKAPGATCQAQKADCAKACAGKTCTKADCAKNPDCVKACQAKDGSAKCCAQPSCCDKSAKKCAPKDAGTAKSTAPSDGKDKT
jgi:hypothetical protein